MEKLGEKRGLSTSQLKWLSMITMLIDHLDAAFGGYPYMGTFLEPLLYTRYSAAPRWVGRMTFPIFAFLLARGCDKSRSLLRYAGRLTAFAVISQIPYTAALHGLNFIRIGAPELYSLKFWDWTALNVMFTLLLGFCTIVLWKRGKTCFLWRVGIVIPIVLAEVLNCSYGALGVLLIFCLWKFPSKAGTVISVAAFAFFEHLVTWSEVPRLAFTSWRVFYGTLQRVMPWLKDPGSLTNYECPIFVCLSLVFILSYNGQRGSMKKWTAYVFYPAHLTAIFLLRELTIALGLFS